MIIVKKILTVLGIFICGFAISSCASIHDHGNGIVLSAKKIQERNFKPHDATKTGAVVGGATGAVVGSVAGAALVGVPAFLFAALAHVAVPSLIGLTVLGAAVGAVTVGSIGAATGAGVGYVVDSNTPNAAMYQFVVQPDTGGKPMTVTQYSTSIPVDSQVRIFEKSDAVYIKQK